MQILNFLLSFICDWVTSQLHDPITRRHSLTLQLSNEQSPDFHFSIDTCATSSPESSSIDWSCFVSVVWSFERDEVIEDFLPTRTIRSLQIHLLFPFDQHLLPLTSSSLKGPLSRLRFIGITFQKVNCLYSTGLQCFSIWEFSLLPHKLCELFELNTASEIEM